MISQHCFNINALGEVPCTLHFLSDRFMDWFWVIGNSNKGHFVFQFQKKVVNCLICVWDEKNFLVHVIQNLDKGDDCTSLATSWSSKNEVVVFTQNGI